ncbi:facilitated trehalose transporter Tret1-like [Colias croceus]|uniref:facilitated trehalose transporter Tret1-like n=1 Tax=Colias crocea TaxID=72248 RepID=UPI001E27BF5A|nr:facilitated trehalose transporter Tret1-like [Colias croceus]
MIPIYTIQQTLVITGIALSCILDGFIFGQMSGMLEALRRSDTSISVTPDDLSWMAASINITCFCGFGIVALITELFGRKKAVSIGTIPLILSWILTYFSTHRTTLYISRIFAGISFGCTLFLNYINIGEYVSPHIRFMTTNMLLCVTSLTGTMIGQVLSLVMEWRNVALIGVIPSILSAVIPFFWVESPMWLASQGRFEECEVAFNTLRTPSKAAEEELKLLLTMENSKNKKYKKKTFLPVPLKKIQDALKQPYFWKCTILSFIMHVYKVVAGRMLFNTLAISILQDITGGGSAKILYYTLVTNSFSVFGASISFIFLKNFKMRQLLIPTGIIANFLLITFGLVLYLVPDKNDYINWIKIMLLASYLVIVAVGPYPVLEAMLTEINPLEIKTFNIVLMGILAGIVNFLAIKLAPSMFLVIGHHGVFFLNAFIAFMCLAYFWFFLPETKGRTLQEIELYFKTNSFDSSKLEEDQTRELINVTKERNIQNLTDVM